MKVTRIIVVDILAVTFYIIAANPAITGLGIHEWISLGLFLVFLVHGIQHYDWAVEVFKKMKSRPAVARTDGLPSVETGTVKSRSSAAQTANLILGILLIAVFMVVVVSGIMISRHILPLLGFVAPGYFFWNPLHSLSAKVLLALAVIHVVAHAGWFWTQIKHKRRKFRKEADRKGALNDTAN